MGKLILYSQDISPPCRAVLMAGAALGLEFDIHEINLSKREQYDPDFLKINPHHTIPLLVDNDVVVQDSHAIMCYLCNKYAKDNSLYPADPQKRALIDQRLYFDNGTLFNVLRNMVRPIIYLGATKTPQEKIDMLSESLALLNKILDGKIWLAGDNYTIADISCVALVPCAAEFVSLDTYPNIKAWIKRCEDKIPGYQKWNVPGNKELCDVIRGKTGITGEENISV